MYGYLPDGKREVANGIDLKNNEEFEQLILRYPEHEVYLFTGDNIDMALFFAPGVSAMLIESRASPDKIY